MMGGLSLPLKLRLGLAIVLGLAGASAALGQSVAADDLGIAQRVLGPASMLPHDIAAMSPATLVEANAAIRAGAERAFRQDGWSLGPDELDVTTEVVKLAGQGVLKTRVQVPARVFYYQYTGVAQGNAVIIVCVSKSARPFNPIGTECERRVNAAFGPGERG